MLLFTFQIKKIISKENFLEFMMKVRANSGNNHKVESLELMRVTPEIPGRNSKEFINAILNEILRNS